MRGRRKRRDVTLCGLVGTYQHVATFVVAFYSEEEQHFQSLHFLTVPACGTPVTVTVTLQRLLMSFVILFMY
jgi:hypothetical protein